MGKPLKNQRAVARAILRAFCSRAIIDEEQFINCSVVLFFRDHHSFIYLLKRIPDFKYWHSLKIKMIRKAVKFAKKYKNHLGLFWIYHFLFQRAYIIEYSPFWESYADLLDEYIGEDVILNYAMRGIEESGVVLRF